MNTYRYALKKDLNGDMLKEEFAAAGVGAKFWAEGSELVVETVAPEGDVRAVVDAHTGGPTPAQRRRRDARERLRGVTKSVASMTAAERNAVIQDILDVLRDG